MSELARNMAQKWVDETITLKEGAVAKELAENSITYLLKTYELELQSEKDKRIAELENQLAKIEGEISTAYMLGFEKGKDATLAIK